jgi:hypothetical protein
MAERRRRDLPAASAHVHASEPAGGRLAASASVGASDRRSRYCVGAGHVVLPLDQRGRTVANLISPRHWRRVGRFLSMARPLDVLSRLRLIRRVLVPRSGDERIELDLPAPVASFDVGRRGSRGLRLFDLSGGTVALVADEHARFTDELRGVQLASRQAIGPRLIDYDTDGRWLREELLDGLDLLGRNRSQIELEPAAARRLVNELLVPLWSVAPPHWTSTIDYADRIVDAISEDLVEGQTMQSSSDTRLDLARRIRSELVSLSSHAGSVPLVWSHGSLNPTSIVEVRGRLHLVDWENADLRPPTGDAWHAVARWFRLRHPHFDQTDATRALAFIDATQSAVLESKLAWREALSHALEPTPENLRVWALAALRRRVRRATQRARSGKAAPVPAKPDLWLIAIDRMLRLGR